MRRTVCRRVTRVLMPALLVCCATARAVAIEPCTPRQEAEWQLAKQQLYVDGRDVAQPSLKLPAGHYIGPVANRKKFSRLWVGAIGGRNWFPADVNKKTLCGRLDRLQVFGNALTGDEQDFHQFITPSTPFSYLFDDVRAVSPRARRIWGEVTLPGALRSHLPEWDASRPVSSMKSPILGANVCIYGPWVLEELHDDQPEIHPAEQFWYAEPMTPDVHWMLIQDVSNRFGQKEDYCVIDTSGDACDEPGSTPASYRPWAEAPLKARLRLAYEIRANQADRPPIEIRHVRRAPQPVVSAPPRKLQKLFGATGRLLVVAPVEDAFFQIDDLDGPSSDACTTDNGDRLQGYVVVDTVAGRTGSVGSYDELAFKNLLPNPEPLPSASTKKTVNLKFLEESLRVDDAGRLRGSFEVVPRAASDEDVSLTPNAPFDRDGSTIELTLAGSDVPETQTLDIKRHDVAPTSVPRCMVSGRFKDVHAHTRGRFESSLEVFYTPGHGGDDEVLAEELNGLVRNRKKTGEVRSALLQRRKQYRAVFGEKRFTYDVSATFQRDDDAESGERDVPVVREACPTQAVDANQPVAVCLKHDHGDDVSYQSGELVDAVIWSIPEANGRLTLRAVVTDPFGQKSTIISRAFTLPRRRIDSGHPGLTEAQIGELARWTRVPEHELRSLWALDEGVGRLRDALSRAGTLCGERARRARLLHLRALATSRDGHIAEDERDILRKLADQVHDAHQDGEECAPPSGAVDGASEKRTGRPR